MSKKMIVVERNEEIAMFKISCKPVELIYSLDMMNTSMKVNHARYSKK